MAINNPAYLVIIKQVVDPSKPNEPGPVVTAPLPETTAFDSSSEYAPPFAQGVFNDGAIAQTLSSLGMRVTTQAMTAQLWQGSSESEIMLELDFQTETDPDKDVRQPILTLLKLATASVDAATGLLKSPGPRISLEDVGRIVSNAGEQLLNSGKQVLGAAGSVSGSINTNKGLNGPTANLNSNNKANGQLPVENGLGGSQYWKSIVRNQISVQIGLYSFFDSVVILNTQVTYSNQIDALTGLPLHAKVSVRFKPLFLVTQDDLDKILAVRT